MTRNRWTLTFWPIAITTPFTSKRAAYLDIKRKRAQYQQGTGRINLITVRCNGIAVETVRFERDESRPDGES